MRVKWWEKSLACPNCRSELKVGQEVARCLKCRRTYRRQKGIWKLLVAAGIGAKAAKTGYEVLHQQASGGPDDGSYEILASMARGNKTIDIACGEGIIERLAPETIGTDFSLNALNKARASGVQNLVLASAEVLPFQDDSFEIAICAGSLEHFSDPSQAIREMARVAKIQVLTVHREFDVPFIRQLRTMASWLLSLVHQPIERPLKLAEVEQMLQEAGLNVVFKGLWTLPVNYGRVIRWLPEFKTIPSCLFVIATRA